MPTIRIRVDVQGGKNVGRLFSAGFGRHRSRVLRAIERTLDEAADEILEQGREDIASAGNFGSRWTEGLQAAKDFGSNRSVLTIFHLVPYWRVFQFGATIHGKPMLWIPLSFSDAVGKRARDYGRLFRVDRKSGAAPLLLSYTDKQPKYFGKESVTIPKKFRIVEIARAVANRLREIYRRVLPTVR